MRPDTNARGTSRMSRPTHKQGRDHTLFSLIDGNVQFHEEGKKGRTGFVRVRKMVSIIPTEMRNDATAVPPAPKQQRQRQR